MPLYIDHSVLFVSLQKKMITKKHSSSCCGVGNMKMGLIQCTKTSNVTKFFNAHSYLHFISNLILFVVGISLGIILALYFKRSVLSSDQGVPMTIPVRQDVLRPKNLSTMEDTDEKALFWRAVNVPMKNISVPKVAFMFLTNKSLPLAPLWDKFFKGHGGKYSVYVHSHPLSHDTTPKGSAFHGTRIPSKAVEWGTTSMIDAERRLLANALLDFSNQRFVLLSESCIPLFNFTTVYNYIINSKQSFLSSIDDPRREGLGRYNKQMWPTISPSDWRKGSQWFELHRDLAIKVVSDTKYYPVFHDFCTKPCFADEHYLPTLVNVISPELNSNRSVTLVDWSVRGPHPRTFKWEEITVEFMERLQYGTNCMHNGNETAICFLFARKFSSNTVSQLLKIAPRVLGFDP